MPPVCVWVLSALWSYDWTVFRDQQRTPYHCYSWLVLLFVMFHTAAHLPTHAGIDIFTRVCTHILTRKPDTTGELQTYAHISLFLASCKGITQICQILEFQIFMKCTLSAISQSTPG